MSSKRTPCGARIHSSRAFAVSLAAGLATEFLSIIATAMLSANPQRMVREKVFVRRLEAIQDLSTIGSLCSETTRMRVA